jgi:hypothetical protein
MTTPTIDPATVRALAKEVQMWGEGRSFTTWQEISQKIATLTTVGFAYVTLADRLDAIREAVNAGRWDEVARLAKET